MVTVTLVYFNNRRMLLLRYNTFLLLEGNLSIFLRERLLFWSWKCFIYEMQFHKLRIFIRLSLFTAVVIVPKIGYLKVNLPVITFWTACELCPPPPEKCPQNYDIFIGETLQKVVHPVYCCVLLFVNPKSKLNPKG